MEIFSTIDADYLHMRIMRMRIMRMRMQIIRMRIMRMRIMCIAKKWRMAIPNLNCINF